MLYQASQENIGSKKVGFSKKTHWDGFNGTADLLMEEGFPIWMKFKLKGGKILEDTYWQ